MMYVLSILLGVLTILTAVGAWLSVKDYANETHFLAKYYLASIARRTLFVFLFFLIAFLLTAHSTFSS